jgi:hypothetical protein
VNVREFCVSFPAVLHATTTTRYVPLRKVRVSSPRAR